MNNLPKLKVKRKDCIQFLTENSLEVLIPQKVLKNLEKNKKVIITSLRAVEQPKEVKLGYETKFMRNGYLEVKYETVNKKVKGEMRLNDISGLIKD